MGSFRIEVRRRGRVVSRMEQMRHPEGVLRRRPDGLWEEVPQPWVRRAVDEAIARGDMAAVRGIVAQNPNYWLEEEVLPRVDSNTAEWITRARATRGVPEKLLDHRSDEGR